MCYFILVKHLWVIIWGLRFPFLSTETDDYAEIIDEEDTYTMPSSK